MWVEYNLVMASTTSDSSQESAFIREVDEDLREERLRHFWQKYGSALFAAAVALVVLVGGHEAWKQWQDRQATAHALRYDSAVALIESGHLPEGTAVLAALAADTEKGYRTMAILRHAAALAQQDRRAGLALWRQVAADSSAPRPYREAAALLAVVNGLGVVDPAEVTPLLEPLMNENNPWHFSALEIKALLALQQNDTVNARALFTRLTDDPQAPAGVRSRARLLMQGLPQGGNP
ncbi:MAG: hypothetical protein FD149_988 [Rhodospirillaceae bacterium]|nr:MAG: hypothetical protein FD149_988 [Rhodospirillaceae bacterium]